MSFLSREWSDAEKWVMGLLAAVILAGGAAVWNAFGGGVVAVIGSKRDLHSRCIDAEIVLRNESKSDATDIALSFDVDYFTRQGTVLLEYGDEQKMLVPPGQRTLLPRQPFIPVANEFDQKANVLHVPSLRPGEYLHLYFGGETVVESDRASARERLLISKAAELMDKPHLISAVRKNGTVTLRRVVQCTAQ